MLLEAAAWFVAAVHAGYLLYAVFGGFLGLLGARWLWLHLASSAWSVVVTVTTLRCPLTAIERWLIGAAGGTPYEGTFVGHYLEGPVYPDGYDAQVWFAGAAIALTSYAVVAVSCLRLRTQARPAGDRVAM
jgi:hypothetical protein